MVDSTNLPEVDINQIVTDLNGKMDRDGVNATASVCIESWHDNNGNWYRVYSDGWCEQGGYFSPSSSSSDWVIHPSINFLKPFVNTNWHIVSFPLSNNSNNGVGVYLYGKTTDNFTLRTFNASNQTTMYWEAKGYIR